MPIRARIALFGTGIVALTLLLFGLLVYALASRNSGTEQDQALAERAQEAAEWLGRADPREFVPHRAPAPIDLGENSETFVMVTDREGALIVSTGDVDGAAPAIDPALLSAADGGSAKATIRPRPDVELRLFVQPWSRSDLGLGGYLVVGQSTAKIRQDVRGIAIFLIVSAVVSLLAAFGASWRGAGRALRPLRTMAGTADEIGGAEDLSRRLPAVRTRDEVEQLTISFNGMLTRLEEAHRRLAEALATEKRIVADASHELRTPLTSIRANADFLLKRPNAREEDREAALHDIAAESERMSRLVHDLLILARADAGQHLDKAPLDLLPIVRDVGRQAQLLHPSRAVSVERLGSDGAVEVSGDAETLRRLVWILVDNAAKHTGAGGRIGLGLATHDGHAELRVADDGPGVPPADLERIFERFYRADAARTSGGVGLGLTIARWIVAEHGGRIHARNNAGRGATFVVELPLRD